MTSILHIIKQAKVSEPIKQKSLLKEAFALNWGQATRSLKAHIPEILKDLNFKNSEAETLFNFLKAERCEILKCYCGSSLKFHGPIRGYGKFCSTSCSAKSKEVKEKREKTTIQKYGVSHISKNPEIQKKIGTTNLNRYGSICSAQAPIISEARNKILSDNHLEISQKRRETNIERFGLSVPLHRPEVLKNTKQIHLDLFTQRRLYAISELDIHLDLEFISGDIGEKIKVKHHCGQIFEIDSFISSSSIKTGKIKACPKCYPKTSRPEVILIEALVKAGIDINDIELHNRTILKPYELDIVIKNTKLAIEINGVYWHRADSKSLPLSSKSELCSAAGYNLLHFWDFEIINNTDVVVNMILARLGKAPRVFARKCEFRELTTKEARKFISDNHLQGYANAGIKFGLFYNNILKACATFGAGRFSKKSDNVIELIRFCTDGSIVIGALSKMVSELKRKFKATNKELNLMSYADLRYSTGAGYISAGWILERKTKPNYFWFNPETESILSRHETQPKKLSEILKNYDSTLTEVKNMENNNFIKAIDCGSLVFFHK